MASLSINCGVIIGSGLLVREGFGLDEIFFNLVNQSIHGGTKEEDGKEKRGLVSGFSGRSSL